MTNDIDGSPLLILTQREAQALCYYFSEGNFYNDYHVLSDIWKKAEEVSEQNSST